LKSVSEASSQDFSRRGGETGGVGEGEGEEKEEWGERSSRVKLSIVVGDMVISV
jgi:hypothetical protein